MKIMFLNLFILSHLFAGESTVTYQVDGMMCAKNCPKKVNESLNGIDGIKSCQVDFESNTATIIYDNEKLAKALYVEQKCDRAPGGSTGCFQNPRAGWSPFKAH